MSTTSYLADFFVVKRKHGISLTRDALFEHFETHQSAIQSGFFFSNNQSFSHKVFLGRFDHPSKAGFVWIRRVIDLVTVQ
ncbi:hypothetical protein D3C86_2185340 [compost metagenome]